MRFTVVFDACVLYPAPLRDFLMNLATRGLFSAKWTDTIHDEWIRNLLAKRPDLDEKQLQRTRELMNQAVPDCLVENHEPLIHGLHLPDPDDRHVLAAAIRAGAQTIVTFNLSDFPEEAVSPYDIEAVHPDTFVHQQMDLNEPAVIDAARYHRASLRRPSRDIDTYLDTLSAQGLVASSERLRDFSDFI